MPPIVSDVEIKTVNAGKMLAILVTDSYEKMATAVTQLAEWMEQKLIKPSGPFFTIFYDTIMDPDDKSIKYEVCVQVDSEIDGEDVIKFREDLDQEMAVVTFSGAYDKINIAYDAVFNWMSANSYLVNGASREVYINSPINNPEIGENELVTEIQFPVRKQD